MTMRKEPCIEKGRQWWIPAESWEGKGSCAISIIAERLGSIEERLQSLANEK